MARKILLADDSVTAQNMGRKILADAGYEVITVNNGSAALKKIAETKPDLIVLDVYMPGYSGLEVCQRLKENQETSRIPVLLTVGKLEPFKPEEAKRVRAEGYIVKPFEASELLSALAKLEDKIVPRAEASKPGRFARANAALDEGRYDKSVAIDEDSGWKNRISFPHKKKDKAAEEEDANEAATYNPVNKDLRTVVDSTPAPKAHEEKREAKVEDERVNLAALAPEGLPKDVTPEEIAALAAAAAQVKGIEEPASALPAVHEQLHEETRHEEVKPEAQPVAESSKEAPVADAVTFASQKSEERIEASAAKSNEEAAEASLPAPKPTDTVSVIASLEPLTPAALDSTSGNGSGSHTAAEHPAEEPVTMAAAAGAGVSGASSRWTAVSVALAADEAALSLEHEMQKAYAAFAAAETAHTVFVVPAPKVEPAALESSTTEPTTGTSSAVEAALADPVESAREVPAPEVSQAMSAVASAATEAVGAAVKELEAVAESYSDIHPQVSSEPQPAPVEHSEPVTASSSEAPQSTQAKAEEVPGVEASAPEPVATHDLPQTFGEAKHEEQPQPAVDEPKAVEPEPAPVASAESSESQISSDHAEPASLDKAVESADVTVKKDTDIAATTAAAWANWRRVRETGKTSESPQDAAAMAVAAGAESSPEEPAGDSDPSAIANIVDSVLADLRPKIFEEITRKMGKKK